MTPPGIVTKAKICATLRDAANESAGEPPMQVYHALQHKLRMVMTEKGEPLASPTGEVTWAYRAT
jgi:hypothetical protein